MHGRMAASGAPRRCAPRRSRCCRAVMPRVWASLVAEPANRAAERPGASGCSIAFASMAPRSSTSWSTAPACCARRSKRHCRAGRPRPREFGQFRRLACAARAVRPAPTAAGGRRRRHAVVRDGGFRPLGARSRRRAARPGRGAVRRGGRARGARLLRRYGVVFWRRWSARRTGCRRGGICCAFTAGWRRAGISAAAASSPAFPANSSRCPKRSVCCVRSGAGTRSGAWISLSGADPLNLAGILTPGPKLAAVTGNRLLLSRWRAGRVVRGRRGGFSKRWTQRPNGKLGRRCCAARRPRSWATSLRRLDNRPPQPGTVLRA